MLQEGLAVSFGLTLQSTGDVTSVGIWEEVVMIPVGSRHGAATAATGTLLDGGSSDFTDALAVVANPTRVAEAGPR